VTLPFYVTANSIGALVNLIMGLVIVLFLWRIPQKSRPTWLLLAATTCSVFFISFWFLTSVNPSIWAFWLIPPQFFFTLLASGFWLQFAAQFPQNEHPRLTRFLGVYTAVSILIAIGVIAYYYQQWFAYEAQRFLLMQIIGLMTLSHYFLQVGIFGYKTVYLGRQTADGQRLSAWRAFWRPANPTAKATRLFMLFIACLPLLSFLNILFSLGHVPSRLYYSTFMVGMMFVFTAFTLVYLNHTPDVTRLMDKLLLVTVILLLTVLGLTGRGALTLLEEQFTQGAWESLRHVQVVLTYGDTGAEGLDTAVSLPPGFRYLATYPANQRTADQFLPIFWADGVNPESVIPQMTTRHPNDEQQNNRLKETQVGQLYIGDVDGYLYLNPPFPWQEHLVFITDWQGARLEMGLSYQTYRAIISEQAQLYVWAIILIPLVVLWLFPRFFSQTLVRPLEALLQGVRRVNAGDLNTAVVVQNTDEIGYLTGSFQQNGALPLRAKRAVRGV
jgi:HAMP domain-containing protein